MSKSFLLHSSNLLFTATCMHFDPLEKLSLHLPIGFYQGSINLHRSHEPLSLPVKEFFTCDAWRCYQDQESNFA